jgi:eukaryotic-like serine/threonine-protein kinase
VLAGGFRRGKDQPNPYLTIDQNQSIKQRRIRIDRLLQEALERDERERSEWLAENTKDDPTLADDVQQLLRLFDESEHFIGDTVSDFLEPLRPFLEIDAPKAVFVFPEGTRIGPWRIDKLIGKGGIGEVYLAERSDGSYTKKVALKCIKRGMDSETILQRFRHERQILATLQHPNIATLFDGGLTHDGRPYLVMEYVDGIPIDRYCNEHKLGIEKRLKLFREVCHAVQYAHRNLVVHRDLKPSNILVADDGTVKLLDFGIAKLLDEEDDGLTLTKIPVMTPVYAAPEQIRGEVISTAADVYGLGVVLYEVLTGYRPYKLSTGSSLEAAGAIISQKPDRPSVTVLKSLKKGNDALSNGERTTMDIADARGTNPEKLARRLRGDLDVIVMKALRKEPDRRYTSAEALMEDINRHLEGLPVTARKESAGYRISKFIRRNAVGVSGAAVFLLLFWVLLGLHTNRITQERNRAIMERDIANTERDKANEIAVFLEEMLSEGDPAYGTTRADTLRLRDFVQASVGKVRNELTGQPAIKAQMLNTLGKVHGKLGLHDQGSSLLEEALELRISIFGEEHTEVAASLNDLGIIFTNQGEYEEAERYLRKALDMRRRLSGPDSEDLAGSYTAFANLVHYTGDYEQAEDLYKQALGILERARGPEHRKTAVAMLNLATILHRRGDLDRAEEMHMGALEINRNVLGPEHPLVATSENNLGLLLAEMGRHSDAKKNISNALNTRQQIYGDEHPVVLTSMNNLASIFVDMGNFEDAEVYYRRSLELRKKIHGKESMSVAIALNNLADLLRKKGNLDEAITANLEAVETVTNVQGPDHPAVGIITGNLALKIRLRGDADEAEQIYRQSLSILENTLSPDHPSIARQQVGLAECLADQSRFEAAEGLMLKGYATLLEKRGDVSSARHSLIRLYEAWNKPDEAEKYRIIAVDADSF